MKRVSNNRPLKRQFVLEILNSRNENDKGMRAKNIPLDYDIKQVQRPYFFQNPGVIREC